MAADPIRARSARVYQRDGALGRGFTLIELLVVCAIIIVITALILVDNNKFGGVVTLENLAYDVALTVRQTQIYGIAVKQFGTDCSNSSTNCFTAGYGMYFSLSKPSDYILFADLENTGLYDQNYLNTNPGEQSTYPRGELVEDEMLNQGYYISGLAVLQRINSSTTPVPVQTIDILYRRPEPQAYISASANGGTPPSCINNFGTLDCYFEAQITLTSPKGDTQTVLVDATGQISVGQ